MKKFSALLLGFFLFVAVCPMAAFAAEPYSLIYHYSVTDMVENKAIYDKAFFNQIEFYAEIERAQTEQDKSHFGSITIPNGSYYHYDSNGNVVNVDNATRTFDLTYISGANDYVEFAPHNEGRWIWLRGKAQTSLPGKSFTWSLFDANYSDTFPNFYTTQQQLATYVPYIERDATKQNYTIRMVRPTDTGTPLAVPYETRYRLRFRNTNGNVVENSGWIYYDAGATLQNTYTTSVDPESVNSLFFDVQTYQDTSTPSRRYRYIWRFDIIDKGNQGIVDPTPLTTPIALETNEQTEIKIRYADGYRSSFLDDPDGGNPVLIGDASVLSLVSWTYDKNTREIAVALKGLKQGETTLSLMYRDETANRGYHTIPVRVLVTNSGDPEDGGEDENGGSSGGCNTGFAGMSMLASLLLVVIKQRKH